MSSEGTSKYLIEVRLLPAIAKYRQPDGTIDFSKIPLEEVVYLQIDRVRRLDQTIQIQEYPSGIKSLYHHPMIRDFRDAVHWHKRFPTDHSRNEIRRYKKEEAIKSIKQTQGLLNYLLTPQGIPRI
ncbi:hypothetical protein CEE44_00425 [Candidatus Woesearchaeota archaeon B3_Woes]|nr:MAG: hypothetical protein CEE44_00425 [Candidatus Woesearchaeota archaeon B3_Woes]